jgi:hypothetical protein
MSAVQTAILIALHSGNTRYDACIEQHKHRLPVDQMCSAYVQILCRFYLKKHAVSSHELLAVTAPFQVSIRRSDRAPMQHNTHMLVLYADR